MNEPRRSRKASRCTICSRDVRRGDLIRYVPADARVGEPRSWVHTDCVGP